MATRDSHLTLTFYFGSSLLFITVNSVALGYVLCKNKCRFNAIFKSAFIIYSIVFVMRAFSSTLIYLDLVNNTFDDYNFNTVSPLVLSLNKQESALIIAVYILAVLKMQ
jgi:hypothetical protein